MVKSIREIVREKSLVQERLVEIPEWGVKLLVRGATLLSRAECRAVFPDDPADTRPLHTAKFAASMIIAHCFDPETKKPVFQAADLDWLAKDASPGAIDRILGVINELSGYTNNPVEDAEKNSKETLGFETS